MYLTNTDALISWNYAAYIYNLSYITKPMFLLHLLFLIAAVLRGSVFISEFALIMYC
jgi:hypothetical protein